MENQTVRFPSGIKAEIARIAEISGEPKQHLIRSAMRFGLPALRKSLGVPEPRLLEDTKLIPSTQGGGNEG